MGDENPILTLGDYSKPSHEGYMNTIELPIGNNVNLYLKHGLISRTYSKKSLIMASIVSSKSKFFNDHVNPVTRRTIDQSAGGKLHDHNTEESWALLEDLALDDNESWNDLRDFTKPVKAIALPQDVPSTSDRCLIELENQVQCLMEAYLAPTQTIQVNKVSSSCELQNTFHRVRSITIVILSTNSDTEEEDVSSTNTCDLNLGGTVKRKEGVKEQGKEENEMETNMKVDELIEEESEFETDEEVEEILKEEEDDLDGENFNLFPTMEELTDHEWLLNNPRPPWVKARIRAGSPKNIKISCMVGHFFKRHAYIDLESPINIMSRCQYNQIMTYGLRSRQKLSNPNKISIFVGRIRGLNVKN
ncbi:hypothetical protein Tco_0758385 [Tanacetum coccineum]